MEIDEKAMKNTTKNQKRPLDHSLLFSGMTDTEFALESLPESNAKTDDPDFIPSDEDYQFNSDETEIR